MDDKLVEAVARAIDEIPHSAVAGMDSRGICRVFARAAIAVVIEECAKVADDECERVSGINADRYWQSRRIRDAIRALKEKP